MIKVISGAVAVKIGKYWVGYGINFISDKNRISNKKALKDVENKNLT